MNGITEHTRRGRKVLEVDTSKVEYQGVPWQKLGNFGRRKYENLLFLQHTKSNPVFIYA